MMSMDAVYEALAAASSPEEVKAVLEKEGCKLSKSGPPAGEGQAPPFGKKDEDEDEEPSGNPFAKKSMGDATGSVVKKNFKKFGSDDAE